MQTILLAERPLLLAVLIGFSIWVLIQFALLVLWVLLLIMLAILLAAAVMPIVRRLESVSLPPGGWHLGRVPAVVTVYLVASLILATLVFSMGAFLIGDLVLFMKRLPDLLASLAVQAGAFASAVGLGSLVPSPQDIGPEIQSFVGQAASAASLAASAVGGIVGFFFRLFVVLVLAFFLVVESDSFLDFIENLFPLSKRITARAIMGRIGDRIGQWVLGQFVVAAISGALAGVAALALGLPYPLLIGLATALFDLAPAVGPGVMAIPVFFLGLTDSLLMAIASGVVFLILSQFDSSVASPLIVGRAVRLSPAVVIAAATLGVASYGIIGALVAVPIAMALKLVTLEVIMPWLHDRQLKTPPGEPEPTGPKP